MTDTADFNPLAITCLYRRPEVSRIFFSCIRRMNIDILSAVSDQDDMILCKMSGSDYKIFPNEPLGHKWNLVAKAALTRPSWSHLFISGDDDLYADELMTRFKEHQDKPFLGLSSMYIVHPRTKRAKLFRYENGVALGSGRMLRREIVDAIGGVLYDPDLNKSIDYSGDMRLYELNKLKPFILDPDKPLMIGIKTDRNIWSYDVLAGDEVPYDEALSILPENEQEMINKL